MFLKDSLREDLQRRAEATLQTLPSKLFLKQECVPLVTDKEFTDSTLPVVDSYHSLVPLDLHVAKPAGKTPQAQVQQPTFGYTSWVYKAISNKDGMPYVLRRLESMNFAAVPFANRVEANVRNQTSA